MPTLRNNMFDRRAQRGMVLVELLLVVGLISLITSMGILGFGAMWGNTRFNRRAEELVNTFQMAYEASIQSNRRYAVVLDHLNDVYVLRQFEALDFMTLPDQEAIIMTGRFDEEFQLDYVLYDDLEDTRDRGEGLTEARFYAGRGGWQFGGKVVLRDRQGNPWSIVIHRLGRPVQLVEGDADILLPQTPDRVPF